jgi:CTP synthase
VEFIELRDHPWFVATQAHPELKSRPNRPHPLFRDFVGAAAARLGLPTATAEVGVEAREQVKPKRSPRKPRAAAVTKTGQT